MKDAKMKLLVVMLVGAVGFVLYLAALGPRIIEEAAASPVVQSEKHHAFAKVVRREGRVFSLGNPEYQRWYNWWVVVTTGEGKVFETLLHRDTSTQEHEDIKARREISYELSWDDSGISLIWSNTAGSEGTAYFTGNSVFFSSKTARVYDVTQPLTDEIKKKMEAHPDMAEAAESIYGYSVLTDRYWKGDWVNLREDVLLLVPPEFRTRDSVMSFGPVIIAEDAFMHELKCAKWVFLEGEYTRLDRVTAERVYAQESRFFELDGWEETEVFKNCNEFILISNKDQPGE